MRSFLVILLILSLGSPLAILAGTKEEIIRLQSDVLQLHDQIRMLQKSIDDNGAVFRSLLEQLNDQVAKATLSMDGLNRSLQAQKAGVSSSIDGVREEIQNLSVKLDDTNNRISALQQKTEENQLKIKSLRTLPATTGGEIEPDQAYSAAYNDFLMGNYDLAISGFQDFLNTYPDSEYADNAIYYLGTCYSEQGRQEQAIQTYDQVINLYPKGDKSPVAYFKKALAYRQLERNTEAIVTFKRLITTYPESQEAVRAMQELQQLGVEFDPKPSRRR